MNEIDRTILEKRFGEKLLDYQNLVLQALFLIKDHPDEALEIGRFALEAGLLREDHLRILTPEGEDLMRLVGALVAFAGTRVKKHRGPEMTGP